MSLDPIDQGLHDSLMTVEQHLAALGDAMRDHDADAIDHCASRLHRSLATAVDRFSAAARQGRVPDSLRQRLAAASGQVAAQRESLARATAALDRAIDVLMPGDRLATGYGPQGRAGRSGYSHAVV